MSISRDQIRSFLRGELDDETRSELLKESSARKTELKEFSQSRSGRKVAQAGNRIKSAAGVISEVAEDQTGAMRSTLNSISEFVKKLGNSLSSVGGAQTLNEGESASDALPTIAELKSLIKSIKKLEK